MKKQPQQPSMDDWLTWIKAADKDNVPIIHVPDSGVIYYFIFKKGSFAV